MEQSNYNVFNVYQKNGITNPGKLDAIVQNAIDNGAHLLGKGDTHALFGFDGTLGAFRRATGRTCDAYIVLEDQPFVHPKEYGGSE